MLVKAVVSATQAALAISGVRYLLFLRAFKQAVPSPAAIQSAVGKLRAFATPWQKAAKTVNRALAAAPNLIHP